MESRPPITSSLESLVKKGIPQSGKLCVPVPGSEVQVCVAKDELEAMHVSNAVILTSVESLSGDKISQQRFDVITDPTRAQIETHIHTEPEEQGHGYASGLMKATNEVIMQMISDFPETFGARRVQGVIRDEATDAYRRSIDAVGKRTEWSSRRAKELGYMRTLDDRGAVWVKQYSRQKQRRGFGVGIGSILMRALKY